MSQFEKFIKSHSTSNPIYPEKLFFNKIRLYHMNGVYSIIWNDPHRIIYDPIKNKYTKSQNKPSGIVMKGVQNYTKEVQENMF